MEKNKKRQLIKQTITIAEDDRILLKKISEDSPRHKNKVSTGIRMLCNIFRVIKKEGGDG
jgi:hypothetical protein